MTAWFRAAAAAAALAAAPAAAANDLPAGPGSDLVEGACAACHSLAIVTQQRLSRAVWDDVLAWMVEEQGMPALEADERALVLDYLAEHFAPDTPR